MTSPAPSNAATSTLDPSLPSPRLPLELIDLIIDYCDEPMLWVGPLSRERLKVLAALSRVSKDFAQHAQPRLFKRIVADYPYDLANIAPPLVQLLDALEDNETLRGAVRAFEINFVVKPDSVKTRDSFKKTIRTHFQEVFRSLPNVHTVSYSRRVPFRAVKGWAVPAERVKAVMWKCLPPSARILDLLNFDIKPDAVFKSFTDMKQPRTDPHSIVVFGWHIPRYQQLFAAGGVRHLDFIDLADARSPYVQPTA